LHTAAKKNWLDVADLLLNHSADPNAQSVVSIDSTSQFSTVQHNVVMMRIVRGVGGFNPTVIFDPPPIKLSFCTMGVGNNHINWKEYPFPCHIPSPLDPLPS